MTPTWTWLQGRIAADPAALQDGDGCHPDEAKTLGDYLGDTITVEEAAKKITFPISKETKPADETYRLWSLLSDAMVELDKENRPKILDLLSEIRKLAPIPDVDWSQLPGFGAMWDDLYRLHLHGPDQWEETLPSFDEEKVKAFRRDYDTIGRAESEMLMRGFDTVTHEETAYEVLNLTLRDRAGLDIFMSEIFARLDVAGVRLREKAMSDDTLRQKWARWKETLLELSQEGSRLSDEGRRLAAQCHKLM